MHNSLLILFAKNDHPWTEPQWTERMQRLPQALHPSITRFHRWQDRQARLIGKWLLQQGLVLAGADPGLLHDLRYNEFDKPGLPPGSGIDFNITHSAERVVCAVSTNGPVGIDVEQLRPINPESYRFIFSTTEWNVLSHSPDPLQTFYTIWTKKEAAIKAVGASVDYDLPRLETTQSPLRLNDHYWHWIEAGLGPNYICHAAILHPDQPFKIREIKLSA